MIDLICVMCETFLPPHEQIDDNESSDRLLILIFTLLVAAFCFLSSFTALCLLPFLSLRRRLVPVSASCFLFSYFCCPFLLSRRVFFFWACCVVFYALSAPATFFVCFVISFGLFFSFFSAFFLSFSSAIFFLSFLFFFSLSFVFGTFFFLFFIFFCLLSSFRGWWGE